MQRAHSLISVHDFRKLLSSLTEKRPDICVRYRLLGEMWNNNFVSVLFVSTTGALLNDDTNHRLITISDLSNVMQFEIDKSFEGFQPFFHYEVKPMLDLNPVGT